MVAQLADYAPACQYAIGSVTPDGRVYISFNALQEIPEGSPSLTTGTGHMVRVRGDWTLLASCGD